MPTIDQVAALAGVSRATVSRAFTRPEMLSEATVQRVKTIARDVGYVPNQVARALSTGRHGNLALIVPDVANPFFPPLIRAAQLRADEAGFCVFLGNSDEQAGREDMLVGRFTSQVEGMILVSSRLDEERIRLYAERRPIVLVNRDVAGIPRVLIDSATGITAALAFDDLVAQGLLAGLAERGIDVPGRFSVVGCDDVLGTTTYPPLTTVSARCKEAGQVAADLLMDLLKVKAMRDVRYVLESHLVIRGTTGPVAPPERP